MATAKPETDDLMTCPICFEQFTDPKYLPCLHTLCRLCLKEGGEGKKAETFTCPVCRRVVDIDQTVSSEKIVDTLPENHVIVSFIDSSNVLNGEKCCDACNAKNKKTEAIWWCTSCQEALCENCYVFHKQFKISRNNLTMVPITEVSYASSELSPLESEEPCTKHREEIFQLHFPNDIIHRARSNLIKNHRKYKDMCTLEASGIRRAMKNKGFDKIDDVSGKLRMKTENNFHRLEVQRDEFTEKEASTIKKANEEFGFLPTEVNESVDVTTLQVTKVCRIKGKFKKGTFLPDGRLILFNYSCSELQVYDKDGNYLFNPLLDIDGPNDVCCVSQNEILVSFPKLNIFTRYEVSEDRFLNERTIFCGAYGLLGLAVTQNNLILGFIEKVEILPLDGKLRKTLSVRQPGFTSCVATTSTGKVFYSDEDAIVCKTLDGEEQIRYTHPAIRSVTGIGVDKYANVYASGYGSNSLFVFSSDGKQNKELIQIAKGPKCIGFDSDGIKFFLLHSSGADIFISQFD